MQTESLLISGAWRFRLDSFETGEQMGYHEAACDVSGWTAVEVPCSFDETAPALEFYEGLGWYVRKVDVPASWQGRHVDLRFEGVNLVTRVWVNGQPAGEHQDGCLRFDLPVDELLTYGAENTIAVEVDNKRAEDRLPGMALGWRRCGGIMRHVYLIAADKARIVHVAALAVPRGDGGALELTAEIVNDRDQAIDAVIEAAIRDADGNEVASFTCQPSQLAAGESAKLSVSGDVAGIQTWSPDTPVLYDVEVRLVAGGETIDAQTVRVGFRSIATDGAKVLLNGEEVFLVGFNRHEDTPARGMCVDPAGARTDLEDMKRMGCNFVRLCHYPHDPSTLDLCDELGLMVMGEIPLYWWNQTRKEHGEVFDRTLAAAKRQLASMVRRDINHPSIVFWSASNETAESKPDIAQGNQELVKFTKGLDPSRLVTHVASQWRKHPNVAADDVISINAYPAHGQMARKPYKPLDLDAARRMWEDGLADLHKLCPDKPVFITEYGNFSMAGVIGGPLGEDTHAEVLETEAEGMDSPQLCGVLIWCYADHLWPLAEWFNGLAIAPFGVVTRDRHPLKAHAAAARVFANLRKSHPG